MHIHLHGLLDEKGGAARVAKSLEQGLASSGHEVFRTCEVSDGQGSGRHRCAPEMLGRRAQRDAIVHVHGSLDFATCLDSIAGHMGRVVITLHDCRLFTAGCPFPLDCEAWLHSCTSCPRGYESDQQRLLSVRQAVKALDPLLVAPSRWMAKMVSRAFPDCRYRIIPNGVPWPASIADSRDAKRKIGVDPEARCVMFAAHGGAAAGYKSGGKWRDLWRDVESTVPGAVCLMAGGDEFSREGNLLQWPYLEEQQFRALLRASDVFAYPTRADNHPLVILEAMGEGAACLSFASGGVPEQITDQETGFLIPEGDWFGFRAKLIELMRNPVPAKQARLNAFEAGKSKFAVERMADDYVKLYSRVLREASSVNAS